MVHVEFCYPHGSPYPEELKEQLAKIRKKHNFSDRDVYTFNANNRLVCFNLRGFPGHKEFCHAILCYILFKKRPHGIWGAGKWLTFEEFIDLLESQSHE